MTNRKKKLSKPFKLCSSEVHRGSQLLDESNGSKGSQVLARAIIMSSVSATASHYLKQAFADMTVKGNLHKNLLLYIVRFMQ